MREAEWRGLSEAAHANASRYTWDDATDAFEAALQNAAAAAGGGEPEGGRRRLSSG
jgi:hypothetical protein